MRHDSVCETHGRVSLAGGLAHGNTGTERRYGRVNTWQSRLRVEVSEEGEASTIADTLSPPYPTPCYRQCRSAQGVLAPGQLDQRRCPSASSIAWTRWASTETPDTGHATTRRTSTAEHRKPLTSRCSHHPPPSHSIGEGAVGTTLAKIAQLQHVGYPKGAR